MSIWRVIEVGVVFCSIICCLVFISSPSKEISFSHYLNKLQDQFEYVRMNYKGNGDFFNTILFFFFIKRRSYYF